MEDELTKAETKLFRILHKFSDKYGKLYTQHVLLMWLDMQVQSELLSYKYTITAYNENSETVPMETIRVDFPKKPEDK